MRIYMVPHNPDWKHEFIKASGQVTHVLGNNVVTVHHIGSTAIPAIYAKPVIDMLLVVKDLDALDEKQSEVEALGYVAMGEFGIPGRRYYCRDNPEGDRTHQIHAFVDGSPQVTRHLAFRDFMIENPEIAQDYSNLKRELAAKYPEDIESYMDGKDAFIKEIDNHNAQRSQG